MSTEKIDPRAAAVERARAWMRLRAGIDMHTSAEDLADLLLSERAEARREALEARDIERARLVEALRQAWREDQAQYVITDQQMALVGAFAPLRDLLGGRALSAPSGGGQQEQQRPGSSSASVVAGESGYSQRGRVVDEQRVSNAKDAGSSPAPVSPRPQAAEAETRVHELKTWPEHFKRIADGSKTFEFRVNDRDFRVGDTLRLREYEPASNGYSGREEWRTVTHVLKDYGVPDRHVIMSIRPAPAPPASESGDVFEQVAREFQAQMHDLTSAPTASINGIAALHLAALLRERFGPLVEALEDAVYTTAIAREATMGASRVRCPQIGSDQLERWSDTLAQLRARAGTQR